jgi:rfaE bifunctional protein kinase chain/domain
MLTDRLKTLKKQPTILVIGDLMIDHYIFGSASRLSPEAPVPVVNVGDENITLGGAGNVVQNLISLGANLLVGGIIGNDIYGNRLTDILTEAKVDANGVITDCNRTTTVKTRVVVGSHQMIRIDREVTHQLCTETRDKLLGEVTRRMDLADIVVLSDYNKGLFSAELTRHIIEIANLKNKKIIVDPKGLCYEKYSGAYIIKPNRKELAEAANMEKIVSEEDLLNAARLILEQTGAEYLIVTLSEDGMAIINKYDNIMLPVKASAVFDVTGAGDTVLAVMAYALASGFNVEDACMLANSAAAIVIRQVGSATTSIDEIVEFMESNEYDSDQRKLHGVI